MYQFYSSLSYRKCFEPKSPFYKKQKPSMGVGNLLKTLMALYLSIWLLILKKLKVVYQLDGKKINFGVFLSFVGYFRKRENEPPTRTNSLPSMQRSTSIRERRRFLSDHSIRGSGGRRSSLASSSEDGASNGLFSTQQFILRKRASPPEAASEDNVDTSVGKRKKEKVGTLKYTMRKSLMYAMETKKSR